MNSSPRRRVSDASRALLRSFESFSPTIYLCPAGKPTVGYGHVVRGGVDHLSIPMTREAADALLAEDLAPIEIYLGAVFPSLTQNEFDAVAIFCFNVGLGAFEKSTLFARLKAGDLAGAASQFGRWVNGGGRVLPGLVRRRAAERDLFLTPEAPNARS